MSSTPSNVTSEHLNSSPAYAHRLPADIVLKEEHTLFSESSERNPMSLVGRWNGSALKDGNVVGALRQERDHSLQMKQTCEDERDLCDLHTFDRLKVTTNTSGLAEVHPCEKKPGNKEAGEAEQHH
ncbi:unnamed protein product [Leuciscus chuanchicus]